jgi:two-component system cell cycle response regulator
MLKDAVQRANTDRRRVAELTRELVELEDQRTIGVNAQLQRAEEIEHEAEGLGLLQLRMRARLARADMAQRCGQLDAGARMAMEVNDWAIEHGPRSLAARSHFVLSSTFEALGEPVAALDHALRAIDLLEESTPARLRGSYVLRLADSLAGTGPLETARERYREAEQIFVSIGDEERRLNVLNNLAYTEYEADEKELAWLVAQEIQDVAGPVGFGRLNPSALDTLARIQIGQGELALAEETLRVAVGVVDSGLDLRPVTPAEILLTLAEVQRLRGSLDSAQATLLRCQEFCDNHRLGEVRAKLFKEQAELFAAMGRFQEAFEHYKQFHRLSTFLSSEQKDAAARIREAMFETVEARRTADVFREQARRDGLTGLWNRRYIDEVLPGMIYEALITGGTLVVAFADLDHFKLVNDEYSHDFGDRVLREVAQLLTGTTAAWEDGSLVARMGGEEFLLLVPDVTETEALSRLEKVRAIVADHAWSSIGVSLAVTISIGATSVGPGDTQSPVLARADAKLYEAKRGGRNRVVATMEPG